VFYFVLSLFLLVVRSFRLSFCSLLVALFISLLMYVFIMFVRVLVRSLFRDSALSLVIEFVCSFFL